MSPSRVAVVVAFLLVLGLPFLVRSSGGEGAGAEPTDVPPDRTLIVVTPHIDQIRYEFGHAFDDWYNREYGRHVRIDWRTPGGTSEIVNQLVAQFTAAAKDGRFHLDADGTPVCDPGTIGYDVFFGGGSYEHGKVKRGIKVRLGGKGEPVTLPMSVPAGFTKDQLQKWFGDNTIGAQNLYDPDQYWIGTALSGFGIVFNRPVLADLGIDEPRSFKDLTDPRYANLIALADPRMSGSVTTTYDSILNNQGWDGGWRTLRELCANARYFASTSTRPPIDVSQGEAAAGLAIDFYGRGQAQAVMRPGETAQTSRVGYVDPRGAVYIDADPVTILRGAPHPELSRRFVEFLMTAEAQTLWQLPSRDDPRSANNPVGPSGERLGPLRYELRRMPVQRRMYKQYMRYFVDQVNPFDLASDVKGRGWRSAIGPLMAAFGIDTSSQLHAAWASLNRARSDPSFPPKTLAEMERLFYAMPDHTLKDGTVVPLDEAHYDQISKDTDRWRDPDHGQRALIAYAEFFRHNYEHVVQLSESR